MSYGTERRGAGTNSYAAIFARSTKSTGAGSQQSTNGSRPGTFLAAAFGFALAYDFVTGAYADKLGKPLLFPIFEHT